MQAHDAEADGAVAHVGIFGGFDGVEVDVDDVVEHPHEHGDGVAELVVVDGAVGFEVRGDVDAGEVADGDFIAAGVEFDLGAEVRIVDDAGVVLRVADVCGVFPCHPRVAGLEEHFEHLFPELEDADFAAPDFAVIDHALVFFVAALEGLAVDFGQVFAIAGAEERPCGVFRQSAVGDGFEAFHEHVWNPVRGVHVVGAAAVVAGLFAKIEEVFDVGVPELEVGAERAGALAALIYGDGDVVADFEKRNDAGAFAVRPVNVRAGSANRGPRAAEAARPFREVGEAPPCLGDFFDAVAAVEQVAARKLRVHGAGVEKRGRGRAGAAAFVDAVKLSRAAFAVFFQNGEAHGDSHPENLRRFEALALAGDGVGLVDEVAVEQRLDADVVELQIGKRIERGGEFREVELGKARVETAERDAFGNVGEERLAVRFFQRVRAVGDLPRERLFVDVGQQNARGEKAGVGVEIEQRLCVQHDGVATLGRRQRDGRGAQQARENVVVGEREIQADFCERDAAADVGELLACGELHLRIGVVCAGSAKSAFGSAAGAVFSIRKSDARLSDFDERFLDEILELLDVDETRALFAHAEFDLRLHLAADALLLPFGKAGGRDCAGDLVSEPRNDARFPGSIRSLLIAADDLRKLAGFGVFGFVGEGEVGCAETHLGLARAGGSN